MENKQLVVIEGYKAFNKDLTCKGFQFEENKIFEETEAVLCESGFHFCVNPFDILNYYDINDSEFCKVKALSEAISDVTDDSKHVTSKIEIGVKLGLSGFVRELVDYILDVCKSEFPNDNNVKISAKIGSSGNYACIGSYSDSAHIGSSGYFTQISSSGDSAKIGSSGNYAKIGASGDYVQIGSSGNSAKIGSSGNYAHISSSGDYDQISSSGNYAQISSSGDSAKIGSSGDSARITVDGYDSVCAAIGINSKIKSKIGNCITLAEWKLDKKKGIYVPLSVKSGLVDGEILKADVFYKLENGEFVECM